MASMGKIGSSNTLPQVFLPGLMQRSQSDNTYAILQLKKRNESITNPLVDQPANFTKKIESYGKGVRTVKEEDESALQSYTN